MKTLKRISRGVNWLPILLFAVALLTFTGYSLYKDHQYATSNTAPAEQQAKKTTPTKEECKVPPLQHDGDLEARLTRMGAKNLDRIILAYDDSLSEDGADRRGTYGSVSITLTDNCGKQHQRPIVDEIRVNTNAADAVLAHEYLHYIYRHMNSEERNAMIAVLMNRYNRDSRLQSHLKTSGYTQQEIASGNEQFAYYCTSFSDSHIGPEILSWCNKYIDRNSFQIVL